MADDDKRKFEIPWATLLPLMAALAGVIAQFRPLVSARPSIPSEKSIKLTAEQDVDARLWQDPLTVAQKAKSQLDADLLNSNVPENFVKRHRLEALVAKVKEAAEVTVEPVMLFAVMLDSGPYIEQGESRLRARQAVLEGLNESGFVPTDSEHIGFVTIPGKLSPVWDRPKENPVEDGALLIPWEECRAIDGSPRLYPPGTRRAFILWLPGASFNPRPLENFANLLRQFVAAVPTNLKVKLLGPANSTGLRFMVKERDQPPKPGVVNPYDCLAGVDIISPRATVSDEELLSGAGAVAEILRAYVPPSAGPGLTFRRTILTDDVVLERLIAELKLRHVYVAPRAKENAWIPGDHVVVLTEWDTPYGRSLAKTFEEKSRVKTSGAPPPQISSYRYMHGIDGRLPGDANKSGADLPKPSSGQAAAVVEATEGLDQSDFLRRLALQLRDEDTRSWRAGEGGIRAIGLLGSDIFDKLMILRALRPLFRDVVFFTNNFDAHFERRDDWSDVRNLVVASPFGATIPDLKSADFRQRVAPFRDNNQTSCFSGRS